MGIVNPSVSIALLAADEKAKLRLGSGSPTNVISESGLYKPVMRSDKPEARQFQDWVTRVVLPAIRKDGGYIMGEEKVVTGEMSDDEFVLRPMTILQGKVERLCEESAKLSADLAEQEAEAEAKLQVSEHKISELMPVAAVAGEHHNRGRWVSLWTMGFTGDSQMQQTVFLNG